MHHTTLARAFRRMVAASMPLSGLAILTACGGQTSVPATTTTGTTPDGAGQPNAPGDAANPDPAGDSANPDPPGDAANPDPPADAANPTPLADAANPNPPGSDASSNPPVDAADADATVIVTSCGETIVVTPGPYGSRCAAQCFPLEAGALASIDAGEGGVLGRSDCNSLCGGSFGWFSCQPVEDAGASLIRCQPDCTGRRPEGLLVAQPASGTPLGAYFAEMARLEAASVDAFRHLRRELVAHGAPRRLVRATERAARDEIRHARMTAALAWRYGGVVAAPEVEPRPIRSLEAIALDNVVEGCVREGFGALVATWQGAVARDRVIRAVMARIARDETRHAALAFDIDAWLRTRLDASARARIEGARRDAFAALAADAEETPATIRVPLGLPTRRQSQGLAEEMARFAA
jgi:hypothetical protein